jgi:hypothetical protein
LVLGFDAGCTTCSGLAWQIEERVGDKLEVVSLLDPEMGRWRKQALGEDAPWAPTLVEIRNGKVRAWTGLSMGIALSHRLGPKSTWRAMKVLGEMHKPPRDGGSALEVADGLTRGQFLRGVGGAAAAASALSITGPFASVASAQSGSATAEAKRLTEALREMGPYVKFRQDKTIVLDISSARHAGISATSVQIAIDMTELNNEVLTGKSLTASSSQVEELQARFEPMFKGIARGHNPEAYLAQSGERTARAATACGGNRSRPHPCPRRVNSGRYFRSQGALEAYLGYIGYSRSPGWSSGYAPVDFTKVVPAYGCNNGPFRRQAYGFRSGSRWTYWTQSPEPNPVLSRYIWPAWWWGSYVRWWHLEYC